MTESEFPHLKSGLEILIWNPDLKSGPESLEYKYPSINYELYEHHLSNTEITQLLTLNLADILHTPNILLQQVSGLEHEGNAYLY